MSTVQFDVSGAMVCWDPADCLQHAARDAFLAAGFGDLAPKPRTDYEALKEALAESQPWGAHGAASAVAHDAVFSQSLDRWDPRMYADLAWLWGREPPRTK